MTPFSNSHFRIYIRSKATMIFLIFYAMIGIQYTEAQIVSGQILDEITLEPLANVNISIVGKSIGVISGSKGQFIIDLSQAKNADLIRFSIIGYESKELKVSFLKKKNQVLHITLEQAIIELNEVTIGTRKTTPRKIGIPKRRCYPIPLYKGATSNISFPIKNHRYEIGTLFKIDRWTQLDSVQFNFKAPTLDTLDIQVNIYEYSNDSLINVLVRPIYWKVNNIKTNTSPILDLSDYGLQLTNDFLVSIENYEDLKDNAIQVLCNMRSLGRKFPTYFKSSPNSPWKKLKFKSRDFGLSITAFISE